MKNETTAKSVSEEKRLDQIQFIMDHWDELPERLQGQFEGTITATMNFVKEAADEKKAG